MGATDDYLQSARKLSEAGNSLLNAKHFKELLSVSATTLLYQSELTIV